MRWSAACNTLQSHLAVHAEAERQCLIQDGPGHLPMRLSRRSRLGSCATGTAGPLRRLPGRFRREEARTG